MNGKTSDSFMLSREVLFEKHEKYHLAERYVLKLLRNISIETNPKYPNSLFYKKNGKILIEIFNENDIEFGNHCTYYINYDYFSEVIENNFTSVSEIIMCEFSKELCWNNNKVENFIIGFLYLDKNLSFPWYLRRYKFKRWN